MGFGETEDDRVCLGMVCINNQIQIATLSVIVDCDISDYYQVCTSISYSGRIQWHSPNYAVSLTIHENVIILRSADSQKFLTILEPQIAETISDLVRQYQVDLAPVPVLGCQESPSQWCHNELKDELKFHIVIYGCRESMQAMGDFLSARETFLQHPTFIEEDVPYENPHHLKRPGAVVNLPLQKQPAKPRLEPHLQEDAVETLLQAAEGPQEFREVRVDHRIRTSLKR